MGQLRFLVVIAAAALAALAIWTWLPPTAETQDAVKKTIGRYESLDSVLWPSAELGQDTLNEPQVEALLVQRAAAWRSVADGDALLERLRDDEAVVRRALAYRRRHPQDGITIAAGAAVHLFDVRRRTLKGELLVRAAVVRWVEVSRWDERRDELVPSGRRSADGAPIKDYLLRQTGDSWRVLSASPVDDPPFYYDAATGRTGTGP